MRFKLNELWLSAVDLLMGNRPFSEMLTFLLGLMNFIIGAVVVWTVPLHSNWTLHVLICFGLIVLGLVAITTAIIPLKRIQCYVDVLSGGVIIYAFNMLSSGIGYRQVSYALIILYAILYVWKWFLEGVARGYSKISK